MNAYLNFPIFYLSDIESMKAYLMVKKHVEARYASFKLGLETAGYKVLEHDPIPPYTVNPGDLYLIWNRRRDQEIFADQFEHAGGTVLVAENGYLGKDSTGYQYLALAKHGHNGSGKRLIDDPSRWERLGLTPRPWRTSGEHILLCPNRFIAPQWFLMPTDWVERTKAELRKYTERPIIVRDHPGHWKRLPEHPSIELVKQLQGAWACVIWSSSAGVHSLLAGVPVVCTAQWWVCKRAAGKVEDIETLSGNDAEREAAFRDMSSSQFTLAEIESGMPFALVRDRALKELAHA